MKNAGLNAQRNAIALALTLAIFAVAPEMARAQSASSQPVGMDHSKMDHSKMSHGTTSAGGAESARAVQGEGDGKKAEPSTDSGMQHGEMRPQGGSAPAGARDPHANSGGTTLESGPYVLPGPRQLSFADEHNFGSLLVDRFEHAKARGSGAAETAYEMQAWFGRDYDRLVIKAEGEYAKSGIREARTELLWGHAVASYWDTQLGVRNDSGTGPDRSWLAFGVQGLAPYWFEVDAAAYVGGNGRTALRLGAEYELLLTQRLILQPRAEFNWYGKSDVARDIGHGLSDGRLGLRLRYEFSRQFAPYIGVERTAKFGQTADLARASGESPGATRWVAGLRFWF